MKNKIARGFSKLTEAQKRNFVALKCKDPEIAERLMEEFLMDDPILRNHFLELSENTISSFHLPYGLAPNVVVDNKIYHVPMAIEESSVVAAASHSARFWALNGGFRVTHISTVKLGHVYFRWFGKVKLLMDQWPTLKSFLIEKLKKTTASMTYRGGGILDLKLIDCHDQMDQLFKLELEVDTVNSMGANFINTCLEEMADTLDIFFNGDEESEKICQIIISILSNLTDQCLVTIEAGCAIENFEPIIENMPPEMFAEKMVLAFQIAQTDPYRAATHNKGIMNGIDSVLIATGNDFRVAESAAHAYAARDGQYRGLSWARREGGNLSFGLTLPLAVGSVGGVINLHPLARLSLELLGSPSAKELMGIVASVGLASNFAALRSLVTTGIQKGHMRLHLSNILNSLNVSDDLRKKAESHFKGKKVSFSAVKHFLDG
ncbi:MAG: hydroxymethylglutaryl-CoA reductase, degradative [Bacteroidota bacterium]